MIRARTVSKAMTKAGGKTGAAHITLPPANAQVRTLNNGLEVIVKSDPSHPLVSAQVWVRAGSVNEGEWTGAGLAHLVEHMLFKGTTTRSAAEITRAIQEHGGQVNAYTSFNRTVYWIDGLAEHLDSYLEVLADMTQRSRLDEEELAREMDVIRREMAMDDDDPDSAAQHLLQATAFRVHPLRQPVIGHREVFDQVTAADVRRFVRRHYAPDNCFVVITGDVDLVAGMAAAERHFGGWRRQPREPVELPAEPPQLGPRRNSKGFATDLTRIGFGWVIPGEASEDKPALDVLGFLLGAGRSSRLHQELREKRGIAHQVWAGAWAIRECGLLNIEVECDPADADAAEAAVLAEIERVKQRGPSVAELAKAVRSTLGGQLRSLATTRGQAASLGHSWMLAGSLDWAATYLQAIERLTPRRIAEVAARHLDPQRVNIARVEPQSPAVQQPVLSKADKRLPIERIVLPSGLTLIIGENPRLPLVSIRAQFLAGVPVETDENAGVTQVAAQLMMKGTRTRSAEELAGALENRGGGLLAAGDAHRLILGADVMRGDEVLGLELIADLALNARLPADQLPNLQKRQLAVISEEMEDPLTVALRLCRRQLFSGTPFARTALGTAESVRALKAGDCRQLISSQVAAANGVITIFGDVRAREMQSKVRQWFAKLPKGARDASAEREHSANSKPGRWEQRLDKEQAVLVIGFRTAGLRHPDQPALTLIDEACSDMGSRLFNRIREELGLAYYVGAQSFPALGAGGFYFYVGTDPQKLDLAEKEMLQLIGDLASRGLAADELERAKLTWRASWLRTQQGNAPLADAIGWEELNGHGHGYFQRLPGIMAAVSAADTRRVAAAWLKTSKAFVVRVLPK